MNKLVKLQLGEAVTYSTKRVALKDVPLQNYVTTDNLLQNKAGVTEATNLPPNSKNVSKYENGHILVSNIRPYLKKIWFANREGGCSADVLNLEVREGFDPMFVYYSIFGDDFFDHMMKGAKGSKMPRGDKQQILTYQIPNITIQEQQTIVSVLSTLDAKIELNNKIVAELESLAKTIYEYWFIQFDFPDENGRPYKSSGGKMVWSEALKKEIPEGWEVKKVGDLVDVKRGKNITRKTVVEGDIPVIAAGLEPSCYHNVSNTSSPVITVSGSGANAGYIQLHYKEIWASDCSYIDQTMFSQIHFMYLFLRSKQNEVYDMQKGSAQPHVYPQDIMDIKVLVDKELKMISRFETLVVSLYKQIGKSKVQNQKLIDLRDWLLPMLMNGQVSIKDKIS
ncbi:MAG: restriction endonuclease subunit S [Candidatus Dojkabacteria bacterium]|nr:restriction endonuclease subunit S [Candidatus Dojkabacteria bacterium]